MQNMLALIQRVFIEAYCSSVRCQANSFDHGNLCTLGAYSLVGETDNNQKITGI